MPLPPPPQNKDKDKIPPEETSKQDANPVLKYGISEYLQDINLGGLDGSTVQGKTIKDSTSLYSGTDCIRANRAGYVTLSAVDYQTHTPNCVFYLPLPENFFIPLELNWTEKSEDGFWAGAISKLAENSRLAGGVNVRGIFDAGLQSGARKALSKIRELGGETAQALDAGLRAVGLAYNPNNQLYFEGVQLASAQWSFNLVPKSRYEAKLMYISAKYMMILATPGAAGGNFLKEIKDMFDGMGSLFGPKGEQSPEEQAKAEKKQSNESDTKSMLDQILAKVKTSSFYIPSTQPAFFEYPNLWDFAVYYPLSSKSNTLRTKKVFEWKRLAITSFRIDFGEPKWHDDGYPINLNLNIGVQETIVRNTSNMQLTMPTIIE